MVYSFIRLSSAARIVIAVSAAIIVTACSHASDDGSGPGADVSDMPSVHLEQTIVMMSGGQPQEVTAYQKMLADCRTAGTPTTPIAQGDVAKIGRKKLVETIESNRSSRRVDAWKVEANTPCQFHLAHSGEQDVEAAYGKAYHLDVATNQVDVRDTGGAQKREAVDDGDVDAVAKSSGWKHGGEGNVLGQACEDWTAPTGDRYCVWTGGTKWGFSRVGINALDGDGLTSDGAIVLEATPPPSTHGWSVHTDNFSVGKAADPSTFAMPSSTPAAGH